MMDLLIKLGFQETLMELSHLLAAVLLLHSYLEGVMHPCSLPSFHFSLIQTSFSLFQE